MLENKYIKINDDFNLWRVLVLYCIIIWTATYDFEIQKDASHPENSSGGVSLSAG